MPDLETRPAETIPDVEEITEPGEPTVAHIVKVGPGESAAAKVLVPLWKTQISTSLGTVVKNLPSGIPQAIQKALDFPRYVFGVDRPAAGESIMPHVMPRYAKALQSHREDQVISE